MSPWNGSLILGRTAFEDEDDDSLPDVAIAFDGRQLRGKRSREYENDLAGTFLGRSFIRMLIAYQDLLRGL
jgi:hypothetical protein